MMVFWLREQGADFWENAMEPHKYSTNSDFEMETGEDTRCLPLVG